ncbi:MAG: hypothetical protein LC797_25440 [Chloroflexi bacterium]|nr:hypothetical protein [Chloroflexota bacterium]
MLRKLAALLALWLVLLVLALSTGWNAVWLLVYSLGLLVAGSALWANWNVAGLELRRRHRARRVQVGDTFVEQVVLEAVAGPAQWWPRLWLELHDGSNFPGHHLDGVLSLGPVAHKVWELRSVCTRRGRFTLGPVWVTSGDPFQLERILEVLALVDASSQLTLAAMLSAETSRFARSSTLIVVTSSTAEAWARFCQALNGRGVHSSAVLVEAATFGQAPSTLLLVSSLAAAHIPTYLVKRGDRLEQSLSTPRLALRGYRP